MVSDIHLEFSDINIINDQDCDVLILSGDIMIAQDLHSHPEKEPVIQSPYPPAPGIRQESAYRYRNFLKRVSLEFPHVIYIAGNHESYDGKWLASLDHLRKECDKFPNIYFLENQIKKIDDVTFIGCTLWTNANRGHPHTMYHIQNVMMDYRMIHHDGLGYTKLRAAHTMERHAKSVGYIRTVIEGKWDEKFIVAGHHAPTPLSIHPTHADDVLTNGGYVSDLSEFILDHPQIKLWTHGHTHHRFDYTMGETRIVCNARGYETERDSEFTEWDPAFFVEV